jgi:hypothetical protein
LGDGFGYRVALSGDLAAVASLYGNDRASGAVYVYGRDQGGPDAWGLLATLAPPASAASDLFGSSVAIMDKLILVGELGLYAPRTAPSTYSRSPNPPQAVGSSPPHSWPHIGVRPVTAGDRSAPQVVPNGDAEVGRGGFPDVDALLRGPKRESSPRRVLP